MIEQEGCDLLAKAKALAIQRNLDDSKVECPFLDVCKGTRCYLFTGENMEENQNIANDLRRYERKTNSQPSRR